MNFRAQYITPSLSAILLFWCVSVQAEDSYKFEKYDFVYNPEVPDSALQVVMDSAQSLQSYQKLTRVGGISFSAEYTAPSGEDRLSITYHADRPDGQRVALHKNSTTYFLPIYDWELKPIANFSDSPFTAVVSIFGDGPDLQKYRYVEYHPAFKNTHLGMRLLQADLFLIDPAVFSKAPTLDGRKVYLPGEHHEKKFDEVSGLFLLSLLEREQFQAWVITDIGLLPRLLFEEGQASIELEPYFYFWRADQSSIQVELERYDELRSKLIPMFLEYEQVLDAYKLAEPRTQEEVSAAQSVAQLEAQLVPIFEELEALDQILSDYQPTIEAVPELNAHFKQNGYGSELVSTLAPFVTDAYMVTAGYSALFRAIKENNSKVWQEFLDDVNNSVVLEPVITPNQFRWGG